MRERQRQRRPRAAANVLFELRTKLGNRILDRPTRTVGETADRRTRHDANVLRHLIENIEILPPSLAAAHAVHHLHHPAGPFATGGALTARFVREEPADIIENVHDAGGVVEYGDGRRAEAETANLAGAVEVERCVEFGL